MYMSKVLLSTCLLCFISTTLSSQQRGDLYIGCSVPLFEFRGFDDIHVSAVYYPANSLSWHASFRWPFYNLRQFLASIRVHPFPNTKEFFLSLGYWNFAGEVPFSYDSTLHWPESYKYGTWENHAISLGIGAFLKQDSPEMISFGELYWGKILSRKQIDPNAGDSNFINNYNTIEWFDRPLAAILSSIRKSQ